MLTTSAMAEPMVRLWTTVSFGYDQMCPFKVPLVSRQRVLECLGMVHSHVTCGSCTLDSSAPESESAHVNGSKTHRHTSNTQLSRRRGARSTHWSQRSTLRVSTFREQILQTEGKDHKRTKRPHSLDELLSHARRPSITAWVGSAVCVRKCQNPQTPVSCHDSGATSHVVLGANSVVFQTPVSSHESETLDLVSPCSSHKLTRNAPLRNLVGRQPALNTPPQELSQRARLALSRSAPARELVRWSQAEAVRNTSRQELVR